MREVSIESQDHPTGTVEECVRDDAEVTPTGETVFTEVLKGRSCGQNKSLGLLSGGEDTWEEMDDSKDGQSRGFLTPCSRLR